MMFCRLEIDCETSKLTISVFGGNIFLELLDGPVLVEDSLKLLFREAEALLDRTALKHGRSGKPKETLGLPNLST